MEKTRKSNIYRNFIYKLYRLNLISPRQTNHELTHAKSIFYGNVFSTSTLMNHKEVTRPFISVLISQVEPLVNQMQYLSWHHIISHQDSGCHFHFDSPSRDYLLEHHCFTTREHSWYFSCIICSAIRTSHVTVLPWTFPLSRCWFPFFHRRSETCQVFRDDKPSSLSF